MEQDIETVFEVFRGEVQRLDFRYRCEDCVHRCGDSCSLTYPNRMLQGAEIRSRDERGIFVFCKYFELE